MFKKKECGPTACYHGHKCGKETADDPIDHPSHYCQGKIQCWDYLDDAFPTDPHLWIAGKYLHRSRYSGEELDDLYKAKKFIERKIQKLEAQKTK